MAGGSLAHPSTDVPEPPALRRLRLLVMALLAVMTVGFAVLVGALVLRLTATGPELPATVTLPDGAEALAVTQGGDWFGIVTSDDRILIYDRLTGRLRQSVAIERPAPSGGGA